MHVDAERAAGGVAATTHRPVATGLIAATPIIKSDVPQPSGWGFRAHPAKPDSL
jgi:hypothetical protein